MPSDASFVTFLLDQLSPLGDVCVRKMMGEYVLYHEGKVVGGIYDNRFLLKPVPELLSMVETPELEAPYQGAKLMVKVMELESQDNLCAMVFSVSQHLPEPKQKIRKK